VLPLPLPDDGADLLQNGNNPAMSTVLRLA